MNIQELLYKTPEMTEERLLEIMKSHLDLIKPSLENRIEQIYKDISLEKALLNEYDTIQEKKSCLTRSERNQIIGFVGLCMIQMTKNNE